MNSLVGYGVSSDSDSDGDAAGDDVNTSTRDVPKSRNFLLETGSASSESDAEEPQPEPPVPRARAAPVPSPVRTPLPPPLSSLSHKLPPPPLGAASRSSVFANPFKAQADEKLNALQKHVPLTLQAKPSQIGGKRMCVAYRKDGRCRFGIKCKFAHDSDLPTSIIPSEYDPPSADDSEPRHHQHSQIGGRKICTAFRKDGRCRFGAKCKFSHDSHLQSSVVPSDYDPPRVEDSGANSNAGVRHNFYHNQGGDDEETDEQETKKRRVGLSNTLVPPKRAMKQYAMQKERERVNLS